MKVPPDLIPSATESPVNSSVTDVSLAELHRQARALVSAESVRPAEARALYEKTAAEFAETGAERRAYANRRRDRVRRAVIAALRHQAIVARRAWIEQIDPASGEAGAVAPELMAQAEALAEAALALHREGDASRGETEYLIRFLRQTSAIAALPAKKPASPVAVAPPVPDGPPSPANAAASAAVAEPPAVPAATAPAVAPPVTPVTTAPADQPQIAIRMEAHSPEFVIVGLAPEAEPPVEPRTARKWAAKSEGRRVRMQPTAVGALAVLGVVGFVAGVIMAPRLLTTRPPATEETRSVAVSPAAPVAPRATGRLTTPPAAQATPAAGSAGPPATSATTRPTPPSAPVPVGTSVALLLRSDPNGAKVFVGGVLVGNTPLRLKAVPGGVLAVTVRRGPRVWRGTVRIGQKETQTVTVRLPQPAPPVAQAPPTPAATPSAVPPRPANPPAHFDNLMVQGVDLYRSGWYGPALARFRQAVVVRPNSARAHLWFARAAFKAGRSGEARRALERVLVLAPGTDAAREAQALLNRLRLAERGA